MTSPFRIMFWILVNLFWILLWPVINMFKTYVAQGQYATAVGEDKTSKHLVLEKKKTRSVRAHMFEVCIESSFQPLLQIYLILPCFIQSAVCIDLDAKRFDFTSLQFFAILTSVISLTFSFTKYFVMKQNGAMDFGFSPLSYALILLATLFQVYLILFDKVWWTTKQYFSSVWYCFAFSKAKGTNRRRAKKIFSCSSFVGWENSHGPTRCSFRARVDHVFFSKSVQNYR